MSRSTPSEAHFNSPAPKRKQSRRSARRAAQRQGEQFTDRAQQPPQPPPTATVEVSKGPGKPYFRIDGVQISKDGGEVIHREYRKTPLGDNIQANGGVFIVSVEDNN